MIAAVAVLLIVSGCDTRAAHTPSATPRDTATPASTSTPKPSLPLNPRSLHRWDQFPVDYCVDDRLTGYVPQADFAALVADAFAEWGVPVHQTAPCTSAVTDNDGRNQIGWGSPDRLSDRPRAYEAGLTLTHYAECIERCDPNDPVKLIEADIIIDRDPPGRFANERCLFSTLLHETGHFLGLDHLPPPAIMQTETSACPVALTSADEEAVLGRYGGMAAASGR